MAVEKKSRKLATAVRVAGWSLAGAALYALFLAAVGGGLPMSEFLAVGRDALLPGVVPGGAVPGLSALDLFQLALALSRLTPSRSSFAVSIASRISGTPT